MESLVLENKQTSKALFKKDLSMEIQFDCDKEIDNTVKTSLS